MKCENVIDMYCKLDRHQRVPLYVSLHLMRCKKCRNMIRNIENMDTNNQSYILSLDNNRILQSTMDKIRSMPHSSSETPELLKCDCTCLVWVISGLLIILGFVILPVSPLGFWLIKNMGIAFSLPFGLCCALSISGFSFIFVAKNTDFFIKKFDLRS